VVTIILTTPYMEIDDHMSTHFNLIEVLEIQPTSTFWAWVDDEWCLHQSHNHWEVVPGQWLLYHTCNLSESSYLGIAKEFDCHPHMNSTKENLLK
jgi:hypothetical protein